MSVGHRDRLSAQAGNKQEGKEFFGVNSEEKSVNVKSGENTADLEFLP